MFTLTELPDRLKQIPDPPKQLFIRGEPLENLLQRPCLTVVGSRKVSQYGREITNRLVTDVSRAGVVIVSGLAFGVDALAHRAALEAQGPTIAVLPTSIDNIQPASHRQLAESIVEQGGALVSEYSSRAFVQKWNFVQRNRLASGLSQAVLITEAGARSGTLHTASFALEQGREVLAVPGNITSPTSIGTNNLIKIGATPVTTSDDILRVLGIEPAQARGATLGDTPEEQQLINLIKANIRDGDELLKRSGLNISLFNQTMTMLEITGKIAPLGGNNWALAK
jgi:DNA processing protein